MKGLNFMLKLKILIIATAVFTVLFSTYTYSLATQKNISRQVIRFHILANSDSEEDQALKLKIKDKILKEYSQQLSDSKSIDETRNMLYENMNGIRQLALTEVRKNGYSYNVNVYMARDYFPTKVYGDVSLPAGVYEALRVEIGNGGGHNWWCVMFPPLCYVDVTQKQVPVEDKMMLKNILDDSEYQLITENTTNVKVRFKIVEIWNEVRNNL